jgi:predicted DNA-binding transcriptional regulator AlpA
VKIVNVECVNMNTASATLVNANELARMLSVSVRHIWRMKAMGKLPKPVWIGGCVRWRQDDIDLFFEMGCPNQNEFETRKRK